MSYRIRYVPAYLRRARGILDEAWRLAAKNGALVFIDVYAKNEKEDLSAGDKRALRDFARTFQA